MRIIQLIIRIIHNTLARRIYPVLKNTYMVTQYVTYTGEDACAQKTQNAHTMHSMYIMEPVIEKSGHGFKGQSIRGQNDIPA